MTRITDFGIKRTYVQAGFSDDNTAVPSTTEVKDAEKEGKDERPQKKRKRVRTRKAKNVASSGIPSLLNRGSGQRIGAQRGHDVFLVPQKGAYSQKLPDGGKDRDGGSDGEECDGDMLSMWVNATQPVAVQKPGGRVQPAPDKGVYPNGGSCKLCGETSHLARDCGLRKQDSAKASLHLGTGRDAGADEDDFHVLKRRNREVELEEKREAKVKKREVESKVVQF
ncbi:hypothetical protein APHAL10511_003809 [Amanita phalloides]|nr:hypothetical protein APHAL10511_003809 [Amanita phalloides]